MNKVFILRPKEDWIVDRFVNEWYKDNSDISVIDPTNADVIWLLASWCYRHLPREMLLHKKVITTIHHIVEEKFDQQKLLEFQDRDAITTIYHVPNEHTATFIKKLTDKPVFIIPYWANQNIWNLTGNKLDLRKKYNLPESSFLIGSFQRDTEGSDLISPKLEKGPDLLADAIEKWWSTNKNIHIVLAGWRRQYIVNRLKNAKIPYSYFERPKQEDINDLYQTLDLYPITARYEGGPQSIIECGLLNIPVVSRNIGLANKLLPQEAISDDVTMARPHVPTVKNLKLPLGYYSFRKLIEEL